LTIHRAQGMTLDKVECKLSEAFAPGQAYVALSRVRELQGLFLQNFSRSAVKVSQKVLDFDHRMVKVVRFSNNQDEASQSEVRDVINSMKAEEKAKAALRAPVRSIHGFGVDENGVVVELQKKEMKESDRLDPIQRQILANRRLQQRQQQQQVLKSGGRQIIKSLTSPQQIIKSNTSPQQIIRSNYPQQQQIIKPQQQQITKPQQQIIKPQQQIIKPQQQIIKPLQQIIKPQQQQQQIIKPQQQQITKPQQIIKSQSPPPPVTSHKQQTTTITTTNNYKNPFSRSNDIYTRDDDYELPFYNINIPLSPSTQNISQQANMMYAKSRDDDDL